VHTSLARVIIRRLISALLLVLLVSTSALVLTRLAPADSSLDTDPAVIAAERERLDLDRPFAEQYVKWLTRSVTLDLGESIRYRRPVADLLRDRAGNTALLGISALLVATLIGIPLGVLTGSRRTGVVPAAARGLSLVFLSVPPLISSLLMLMLASRTGWFPSGGMGQVPASAGVFEGMLVTARHLLLPSLALALPIAASLERLQSRSIMEALTEPCVAAARARGIPRAQIVWRHGFRLSLRPVLAIYGVTIGSVLSGSFAVEIVMSWPGLGDLMWEALKSRDVYLVAGCAATGALFLAVGILLADLALAWVDPRTEAG
jgi:peptide/nickel transport system permease protein